MSDVHSTCLACGAVGVLVKSTESGVSPDLAFTLNGVEIGRYERRAETSKAPYCPPCWEKVKQARKDRLIAWEKKSKKKSK